MTGETMRVILFKDGEKWIAQGLEHDICASATTVEDVFSRFAVAVEAECKEHGGSLAAIAPAPAYYQRLWETRASNLEPVKAHEPFSYGLAA